MRISDWSSDVCSSDLVAVLLEVLLGDVAEHAGEAALDAAVLLQVGGLQQGVADLVAGDAGHLFDADHQHEARRVGGDGTQSLVDGGGEIGRASCRESVCQYV